MGNTLKYPNPKLATLTEAKKLSQLGRKERVGIKRHGRGEIGNHNVSCLSRSLVVG
jgi:hypothetical protein